MVEQALVTLPREPLYKTHQRIYQLMNSGNERNFQFAIMEKRPDKITTLIRGDKLPYRETQRILVAEVSGIHGFTIQVNPTVRGNSGEYPIEDESGIRQWFAKRSEQNGFRVLKDVIEIYSPMKFMHPKKGIVYAHRAKISGVLEVTDRKKFKECLRTGIGRMKTYGFGLLVVSKPIKNRKGSGTREVRG